MPTDNSAEILVLEAILNSGAESVSTDGQTTKFDLDAVRKRLSELRQQQAPDITRTRPRISTIDLSGAW
jgi:hypothetical protein